MSFFNKIRSLFGINDEVSNTPLDQLDIIAIEQGKVQDEIAKANAEFDDIDQTLSLKIAACNKLIEKGVKEGADNKKFLVNRLDRITTTHLELIKGLIDQSRSLEKQEIEVESELITKAVEVTAGLSDENQKQIKIILDVWSETGIIKGEEIDNQARAITLAIEEIVKGGEGSRGGKVIGHTRSGKAIYDTANHESHNDFTKQDHDDAISKHKELKQEQENKWKSGLRQQAKTESKFMSKETMDAFKAKNDHSDQGRRHATARWNAKEEGNDYESKTVDELVALKKKLYSNPNIESAMSDDEKLLTKTIAKKYSDINEQIRAKREIKKSHEPIAIEIAGKGDVEYDSPVEGHYANVIVRRTFKEGEKEVSKILFLKRASTKVVEPNKFCLPGGHIDEGETIEVAALRELKEEANLDASYVYTIGKAKCDDGRWAFYLEAPGVQGDTMLLDGESINAAWMSQEEWIEADLIFDLKDHLVAMETSSRKTEDIRDILKKDEEDELEKGGEGSRGGKIIGHTKSGKPVYASKSANEYSDFSKDDHKDASNLHDKQKEDLRNSTKHGLITSQKKYVERSKKHENISNDHFKNSREKGDDIKISGKGDGANVGWVKKAEDIDELEKAFDIDNPFYYNDEEELIKGRAAAEGEERTWGGKKYKKSGGKWMLVGSGKEKSGNEILGKTKSGKAIYNDASHEDHKNFSIKEHREASSAHVEKYKQLKDSDKKKAEHHLDQSIEHRKAADKKETDQYEPTPTGIKKKEESKKLSTKQLKEHVENTSTDQLKKVAEKEDHPHNDAAKRELERRGETKKEEEFLQNNKIFLKVMSNMIDKRSLKAEKAVKDIVDEFGVSESTARKGLGIRDKE